MRVRFGRYVVRRLRKAGHSALATSLADATAVVKAKASATDDAQEPVEDALADRDAIDELLDDAAQEARNRLAGRGVKAVNESPYTDIFGQGIAYYTASSLESQARRYKELRDRAVEYLPDADTVRIELVAALDRGLAAWQTAVEALDAARNESTKASSALAKATDAWTRQVEKTYGVLVSEVGRTAARRFFPRSRRSTSRT